MLASVPDQSPVKAPVYDLSPRHMAVNSQGEGLTLVPLAKKFKSLITARCAVPSSVGLNPLVSARSAILSSVGSNVLVTARCAV